MLKIFIFETGSLFPIVSAENAAGQVLESFLTKVFRRDPTEVELNRYLKLFKDNFSKNIPYDIAIQIPVKAALCSPSFLLRNEQIDEDNFYIHEDRMYLTIDISRYTDLEANSIELNLADAGISLQVMKTTQLRPFKKFNLPEPASRIIEWTFNNGVLDVTFDINSTMYI